MNIVKSYPSKPMKNNYSEFSVGKGVRSLLAGNFQKPGILRFFTKHSVLGAFSLLLGGAAYSQTYQPIAVTGFTDDVIANGVGNASVSTDNNIDGGNFAFVSNDFQATESATPPAYGLNASGLIASAATTGLTYQMASFTGDNSLRLAAINSTGTLTVTTPVTASTLYVLATSGAAVSNFSVTITFSDATTQVALAQSVPDWFYSTALPVAASGFGRINRVTNALENPTGGNPRLYQLAINIPVENQGKTIQSVQFTKTAAAGFLNIFAISKRDVPPCPIVSTASGASTSFTSGTVSWTLGSMGAGATEVTYTLEVYTDAAFTTPVAGSPFTGITGTSQTVSGLTFETTYYYRVKANNGTCDSEYVTGNFTLAYCVPTTTSTTLYGLTNFSTAGGFINISNPTGYASYTNFSATHTVAKAAGESFTFTATKYGTSTTLDIWVDWNNDLIFSDSEKVFNGGTTNPGINPTTGTITIPAGTPNGNYRMRVRSRYFSYASTPCGNITYGDAEDYTLGVGPLPADCPAPAAPVVALTATGSTINGTVTAPETAPTGYLVVRSTTATLTETPVSGTSYAAGTAFGGGTVVTTTTTPTFGIFLASNTQYYVHVFAYNNGGLTCYGPIYSPVTSNSVVTCARAVQVASASNITHASANLNWSNIVGPGGNAATYTVEVYTNAALTALLGSYTSTTNSYAVTGLTNGATYWYRVKGEAGDCDNDAWSATASFVAQNAFTPVDVTGHNADVIANGTGIANASTNAAVDAVNNAYVALDYERVSGTVTTVGLPVNRTLSVTAPAAVAGLSFLLPDYSENNALRLPAQNQNGTFTLDTPRRFTNVYLSLTSGSGPSTISAQLQFEDGTTQTASTFTLIDWYQPGTTAQPALISNIGRANRANAEGNVETGNSKVFYVTIPVEAANQSKLVSGIVVTKTSTGATEPVPNIFSVSGRAVEVCPVLESAFAGTATANGGAINWALSLSGATATSYTVEIYTDAAFTTPVAGSPFTGLTGTSYTATGLNASTTYYFRVSAVTADCTSAPQSGSFTTLCATPALPTAAAQSFCGPATISQLSATGVAGATFSWYATNTSTTPLAGTTALATGLYFVSQTLGTCESLRTQVSVTVNTTAAPVAAAQSFCGSATVADLEVTALEGAAVAWSATEGGEALESTEALATGTYYVTQTLNNCASVATAVTVTVTETPAAPVANAQSFCGSATAAQLEATGTALVWSATQGGAALEGTAALATGTYYVTQTVNGCTSAATAVTITVNPAPAAPVANAQSFCGNATVAQLEATGTALVWSASEGGAALEGTETLATGTYYVTQTVNGCVSAAATVSVTVNTVPAAPVTAAQTFCAGATAQELEATGETGAAFTWYATEGGQALEGTEVLATGTYYVTQTLNGCESATATLSVTVNTTAAPVAAAQSFCGSATVAQLEATGEGLVWSATEGGAALGGTEALATGTYYVTQTLNDCTSVATAVSVTVNAVPDAPEGEATQTFTEGSAATVASLDITTVEGATVTWYVLNDAWQYVEIPATTVLENGATYYVTQTVNGCESTYFAITVSQVAGTGHFGLSSLVVYPNPAQDIITLTNSDAITGVAVVNLLGQTVLTQSADSQTVQVDLTRLAAGTYLVQVATANASATVKVVKK
jgi:hypothetical protein